MNYLTAQCKCITTYGIKCILRDCYGQFITNRIYSTLTDRYQTTIPDAVRKALHLNKRYKILYTVQPDGYVLLSKIDENHDDPIIDDFLNFIADDIKKNPQHLTSINQTLLNRIAGS